jgi:DNA-binding transcriptional ArsR family regulator
MTAQTTAFESLDRLFHEPNRLAIMSVLCGADKPLSFNDLKMDCGLTDGNLNRHLHVLQQAGAVSITKQFVGAKPLTTVTPTDAGVNQFNEYLNSLSEVLKQAKESLKGVCHTPAEAPGLPSPA